MDIANIVSDDYVGLSPETRVSKLVSTFENPTVKGVVVRGNEFEGVVTRRQLATSHHQPNEKLGSLVWDVPRLAPDEDVRKVARLMIDNDSHFLPVFEKREPIGVVTVDGILQAVQPFLDAATVGPQASLADDVRTGDQLTESRRRSGPVFEGPTRFRPDRD